MAPRPDPRRLFGDVPRRSGGTRQFDFSLEGGGSGYQSEPDRVASMAARMSGNDLLASAYSDGGGAPSLFDQIKDQVAALPSGLGGLANSAVESTVGGASALIGQIVAPDVSAEDLRNADGPAGVILRALTNEQLMEDFESERRGQDVSAFEMWKSAAPILSETGESMVRTGGHITDQVAALAPGGKAAGDGYYGQAIEEGRIVEALVEDVGNIALLGKTGARGISNASRARAASAAGAAPRTVMSNLVRGEMARGQVFQPASRLGQVANRADRAFSGLDEGLGRAILSPYRGVAKIPNVISRYMDGSGGPLEFGARLRSGRTVPTILSETPAYMRRRDQGTLGRVLDSTLLTKRTRPERDAQADVQARLGHDSEVVGDATRASAPNPVEQVASNLYESRMAEAVAPVIRAAGDSEGRLAAARVLAERPEWADAAAQLDGGADVLAAAMDTAVRFLDGELDEATASRISRTGAATREVLGPEGVLTERVREGYGQIDPVDPQNMAMLLGDDLLPHNVQRVLADRAADRIRLERRQDKLAGRVERRLGRLQVDEDLVSSRGWRAEHDLHRSAARSAVDEMGVRDAAEWLWGETDADGNIALPKEYAGLSERNLRSAVLDQVMGEFDVRLRSDTALPSDWISGAMEGLSPLPISPSRVGARGMREAQARAGVADQAVIDEAVAAARADVESVRADQLAARMENTVREMRRSAGVSDVAAREYAAQVRSNRRVASAGRTVARVQERMRSAALDKKSMGEEAATIREGALPIVRGQIYDAEGPILNYYEGPVALSKDAEGAADYTDPFLADAGLTRKRAYTLRFSDGRRLFSKDGYSWDQVHKWMVDSGRLPESASIDDAVSAYASDVGRWAELKDTAQILEGRSTRTVNWMSKADRRAWKLEDEALRAEQAALDARLAKIDRAEGSVEDVQSIRRLRSEQADLSVRRSELNARKWSTRYEGGVKSVRRGDWDDMLREYANLMEDSALARAVFDPVDPVQAMTELQNARFEAEWETVTEKAAAEVNRLVGPDGEFAQAVEGGRGVRDPGLEEQIADARDEWAALNSTTEIEFTALQREFDRVRREFLEETSGTNRARAMDEGAARQVGGAAESGVRAGRRAGQAEGRAAEARRQAANARSRARSSVDPWEAEQQFVARQTERAYRAGRQEAMRRAKLAPLQRELEEVTAELRALSEGHDAAVRDAIEQITSAPGKHRLAIQAGRSAAEAVDEIIAALDPADTATRAMLLASKGEVLTSTVDAVNRLEDPMFIPGGTLARQSMGAPAPVLGMRRLSEEFVKEGEIPGLDVRTQMTLVMRRMHAQSRNEVSRRLLENRGRSAADFFPEGMPTDAQGNALIGEALIRAVNENAGGVQYLPVNPRTPTMPVDSVGPDTLFVPRFVKDVIDAEYAKTSNIEKLAQLVIDQPTRYWKHSVLALRPAWQQGNIIGNFLQAWAGGVSPGRMLELARDAWRMYKDKSSPFEIRSAGVTSDARAMYRALEDSVESGAAMTERQFRRDVLGGRGDNVVQRRLLGDVDRTRGVGRVANILLHPVQSSYNLNQGIDDFTHNLVYLDRVGRGVSPEQAIRDSLRVAGDFTRMSKFERQVMRRIMPFYAWMRHITGLTADLVLNHPLRTAWTLHLWTLFGDEESADLWEGIPSGFGRVPYRGSDTEFVSLGNLMPFGTAMDVSTNPVDTVLSSLNPLGKLGVYAGTGMEIGMEGVVPGSRAYWEDQIGGFGSERFGPPGTAAVLEQLVDLFPQARLFRDLNRPRVARYDTGTPVRRGGATIPDESLQSTSEAILRDLVGVPFMPRTIDPAAIRQRREEQVRRRRNARPGG